MSSADTRQESRARWGRAAALWGKRAEDNHSRTVAVSAWLVDAIAPQPGHTVLELAAGVGDTGFLAAELIQPGGTLICSDFAPEMLTAAQERARALGVTNVRFRQIDAETSIDLPAASVDGVLCRWGYMLMTDPGTALRETRRVLKPGARVALSAWADPEDNPWTRLPGAAVARRGLVPPAEPGAPGMFGWAQEGAIVDALEGAGFVEHHAERLRFHERFPDFDAWWSLLTDMGITLREALQAVDEPTRAEIREEVRAGAAPWTAADGSLALPASTWVAWAAA